MPILVDGFNLLHAARAVGPAIDLGQLRLCELLGQWSRLTGESVTIVFDGMPPPAGYAEQLCRTGITVQHSGTNRTADDWIIEAIQQSTAPRRLIVVSTDRQIRQAARRRRCDDQKAESFFRQVWAQLARDRLRPGQPNEPQAKRHGLDDSQTDRWLREFDLDQEDPS